jgi:nitroimidazol reductase NimA-like FMN-containing flavoprotein (pyridoxamine 5'-phosphate oxidase superfamily)
LRRVDKEITSRVAVTEILERARICHIGLCENGIPYVVPMNYGYEGNCLYLHSAPEGRKIDIIRHNNLAAFCVYIDDVAVRGGSACKWTMKYRSVMGEGKIRLIEDPDQKREALQIIMRQQAGPGEYAFQSTGLDKVTVLRLDITQVSGKQSGYRD